VSATAGDAAKGGGVSIHNTMSRNIPGYDASGTHHCPRTNDRIGKDDRSRAQRRPFAYFCVPDFPIVVGLESTIRHHGSREAIVGKTDPWPDERPVTQGCVPVDVRTVLYLDSIADSDSRIDVNTLANGAFSAEVDTFANLRVVPNARPVSDLRAG